MSASSAGGGAMTGEALLVPPPRALDAEHPDPTVCRCSCGHALRVFGGGRHRVYFEPGARLDDPVLSRLCLGADMPCPARTGGDALTHVVCLCCRLRFPPAARHLVSCPECGRSLQPIAAAESVVGFSVVVAADAPHERPEALASPISIPLPDPARAGP